MRAVAALFVLMATMAFPGEVTQIRKAAQVVQNVVTYTVVVAVSNPEGRLLPGMTANVKLVVAEKADVLKVSNAALRSSGGTDPRAWSSADRICRSRKDPASGQRTWRRVVMF